MRDFVKSFYDSYNRRAVEELADLLGERGTYTDPISDAPLAGAALVAHLRSFFRAFSKLEIEPTRILDGGDAVAVEWALRAVCDGALDSELKAHGVAVSLSGVDVFDLASGAGPTVRRTFDRRALADALGLQTIVEPVADGTMTFGYSLRDWVSREKPGALGMTWILARDEAEKAIIRGHARKIIAHFHDVPGFIGIVTGFAGLHGFTFTLWESEDALARGTHQGAHRDAMQAFRDAGLSAGVFTSVWTPARLNRQWTRCPNGHANDATRDDRACVECGAPLPPPEPYV